MAAPDGCVAAEVTAAELHLLLVLFARARAHRAMCDGRPLYKTDSKTNLHGMLVCYFASSLPATLCSKLTCFGGVFQV